MAAAGGEALASSALAASAVAASSAVRGDHEGGVGRGDALDQEAGRIDNAQVGAVAVLDADDNLLRREGAESLQPLILALDVALQLGQAQLPLAVGRVQVARRIGRRVFVPPPT